MIICTYRHIIIILGSKHGYRVSVHNILKTQNRATHNTQVTVEWGTGDNGSCCLSEGFLKEGTVWKKKGRGRKEKGPLAQGTA